MTLVIIRPHEQLLGGGQCVIPVVVVIFIVVVLSSAFPVVCSLSQSSPSSLAGPCTHHSCRPCRCCPRCLGVVILMPVVPWSWCHLIVWLLSPLSPLLFPLLSPLSLLSPLPWCWSSSVLSSLCLSFPGPGVISSSGGCPRGPLWLLLRFRLPCGCGCNSCHPCCQCCRSLRWHCRSHCPGPVHHWCWGVCHWCRLALFPSFHCRCHPKWVGSLVVHLIMPSCRCGSSVACFKRWWGG